MKEKIDNKIFESLSTEELQKIPAAAFLLSKPKQYEKKKIFSRNKSWSSFHNSKDLNSKISVYKQISLLISKKEYEKF